MIKNTYAHRKILLILLLSAYAHSVGAEFVQMTKINFFKECWFGFTMIVGIAYSISGIIACKYAIEQYKSECRLRIKQDDEVSS